jgi:hypothetical protein
MTTSGDSSLRLPPPLARIDRELVGLEERNEKNKMKWRFYGEVG